MDKHNRRFAPTLSRKRRKYLSIVVQAMWYFWWTERQCDEFHSQHFGFPPSISFHQRPKLLQSSLADAIQSRRLTASQITHLKERRRILEDLNLHQHYCEDLTPRRE